MLIAARAIQGVGSGADDADGGGDNERRLPAGATRLGARDPRRRVGLLRGARPGARRPAHLDRLAARLPDQRAARRDRGRAHAVVDSRLPACRRAAGRRSTTPAPSLSASASPRSCFGLSQGQADGWAALLDGRAAGPASVLLLVAFVVIELRVESAVARVPALPPPELPGGERQPVPRRDDRARARLPHALLPAARGRREPRDRRHRADPGHDPDHPGGPARRPGVRQDGRPRAARVRLSRPGRVGHRARRGGGRAERRLARARPPAAGPGARGRPHRQRPHRSRRGSRERPRAGRGHDQHHRAAGRSGRDRRPGRRGGRRRRAHRLRAARRPGDRADARPDRPVQGVPAAGGGGGPPERAGRL